MVVASAIVLGLSALIGAPKAAAQSATIVSSKQVGPQEYSVEVYSPSMRRNITTTVLRPKDTSRPAPTLYLLNGASGPENKASWGDKTDYVKYFANRHVNVVTPQEGAYSYYADWQRNDRSLGRNKWQTFLTKELPPVIDAAYGTTGKQSAAGISMAGTSVFNLAIAAPGLYESVAAYSGCARTSDPLGQEYIRQVVEGRGGADMTNMWGPLNGPGWRANDPYLQAHKLRGTKVYISTGNGLPGKHENLEAPDVQGNPLALGNQIVVGGVIEAVVNQCTSDMIRALKRNNVQTTTLVRPNGTHSWGYWQDDLHKTWPMIERDLR
ncbi:alpha/beta hydrolase [Gordonia phosphorivorans]|uniref:Alpha/beta hydrolase n=1 Tax=Gordonia phosphorivorans TaxID=1056982 RepID=A0ABV6H4W7_9ACTN